jgi:hypothetical protein
MEPSKTPAPNAPTLRTFLLVLVANVAASLVHYVHNVVWFSEYPDPTWLSPARTDSFWFLMTPFAFAAYVFYRRGDARAASRASYAYAAMSLLVLGHYTILPPWRISAVINFGILVEVVAAIALILVTMRIYKAPLEG